MIVYVFIFIEIWIYYNAIHEFSAWLRTGSNPADINRFSKPYWNEI